MGRKAISYAGGFRQSKTALFDWTFLRLDSSGPSSYRQSSLFHVFVLVVEAVGVREYCCRLQQWKSAGSSVLRAFSASNGWANPRPLLVALGLAESRQSYVRGVALSRERPKLQQPQPLLAAWDRDRALLPSCDTVLASKTNAPR